MTQKTVAINLYGGPGIGKTVTASDLFSLLKRKHINCEQVREYVKDWVWEARSIRATDQVYILAKQARKEQILFNNVDVYVTDAPIRLSPVYERKFSKAPFVCQMIVDKFEAEARACGVEYVHVLLRRTKPYQPHGRYQTEAEAIEIDAEIKNYLIQMNLPFIEVDAGDDAAQSIVAQLGL